MAEGSIVKLWPRVHTLLAVGKTRRVYLTTLSTSQLSSFKVCLILVHRAHAWSQQPIRLPFFGHSALETAEAATVMHEQTWSICCTSGQEGTRACTQARHCLLCSICKLRKCVLLLYDKLLVSMDWRLASTIVPSWVYRRCVSSDPDSGGKSLNDARYNYTG